MTYHEDDACVVSFDLVEQSDPAKDPRVAQDYRREVYGPSRLNWVVACREYRAALIRRLLDATASEAADIADRISEVDDSDVQSLGGIAETGNIHIDALAARVRFTTDILLTNALKLRILGQYGRD